MCGIYMGDRLAFLYQRSQDVIHPLDAFRRLIDPFPAGGQKLPVAVICIFGRIELFIHSAVHSFSAAVAYIGSLVQSLTLLRSIFFADITASERAALPAGQVAIHIAAGMFEHTSEMYICISLAGDVSVTIELFYLCVSANLLGYCCRILLDLSADLSKRKAVVKTFFYLDAVRQSQMFLITFVLSHASSLSAQARRSASCVVYRIKKHRIQELLLLRD